MADHEQVGQTRGGTSGPNVTGDDLRGVTLGEERGDPERLVVVGRDVGWPWFLAEPLARPGGRECSQAGLVEAREPAPQRPDGLAVRAVPGLAHGGLPATGEALPGATAERLGQQGIQEGAEHQLRGVSVDRVADRGAFGGRWQSCRHRGLDRVERVGLGGWQELPDRGAEGDGRRLGEGETVELGRRQRLEPREEPFHSRALIDGAARSRLGAVSGMPRVVAVAAGPDAVPEAMLAIVVGAQARVGQPVVGDVDALRDLEAALPRDVGVVPPQERPPRHLDRLDAGIRGDAEAGVQVVGGERRARGHGPLILVGRYAPEMRPGDPIRSRGRVVS